MGIGTGGGRVGTSDESDIVDDGEGSQVNDGEGERGGKERKAKKRLERKRVSAGR